MPSAFQMCELLLPGLILLGPTGLLLPILSTGCSLSQRPCKTCHRSLVSISLSKYKKLKVNWLKSCFLSPVL